MTEQQHNRDVLQQHFELHHFAVDDLTPPRLEQVQQFAELIDQAKTKQQAVAVHCMAGMGRTSTMIIAAQILLGASFREMEEKIAKKNPGYKLTGHQGKFCRL